MDIKLIKKIVNSDMPLNIQEDLIINSLAKDENVIPSVIKILNEERLNNKELISDFNMELSRCIIVLNDDNLKWNKKIISDPKWVVGEIKKHYLKWVDEIKCNFKID